MRIIGTKRALDLGSEWPVNTSDYWAETAKVNCAILASEGVDPVTVARTAPIIQDLANVLASHRRERHHHG